MNHKKELIFEEALRTLLEKTHGPVVAFVEEVIRRFVNDHFVQMPKPDPQYSIQQVAELLCVDQSTVRSYLAKPATHIRFLPHVQCTGSGRGKRIRLSDIYAWQKRNLYEADILTGQEAFEQHRITFGERRVARRNRNPR